MGRKGNVLVGFAFVCRTDIGNNVGVDESTQLLVIDAEIVKETLQQRNHID